jgi:hypothetical protein
MNIQSQTFRENGPMPGIILFFRFYSFCRCQQRPSMVVAVGDLSFGVVEIGCIER